MSAAEKKESKTHPYQTKHGVHAEAVYEQQLLSRPKAPRPAGAGVRKDLLTGTTQVCAQRAVVLFVRVLVWSVGRSSIIAVRPFVCSFVRCFSYFRFV